MFTLACRSFGVDCDEVVEGKSFDEAWDKMKKHAVAAHGHKEEEFNNPEATEMARKLCKET